jgi:uncharacterized protein YecT (DUF1311 family)
MTNARLACAVGLLLAFTACSSDKDASSKNAVAKDTAKPGAPVDTSARVAQAPPPKIEPSPSCSSPAPADQRDCLNSYLAISDSGLNRIYKELIAELKRRAGASGGDAEPAQVRTVRAGEREWVAFRDKECLQKSRGTEGKLWALPRAQCLAEYSRVREQQLAEMLTKGTTR